MNRIVRIVIVSLIITPSIEYARIMSPGVAQTELDRMIRNAKKNPPSEGKIKQLLNDISPSLREEYQDMINQIRSKGTDSKKEENAIDTAIEIIVKKLDNKSTIEDTNTLVEELGKELNLSDKDVETLKKMGTEIVEIENFDINDLFPEDQDKEEKTKSEQIEKSDIKDLSSEDQDKEEETESQYADTSALRTYIEELNKYLETHFTPDKNNKIKKDLKENFNTTLKYKDLVRISESFNTFFDAWISFGNQKGVYWFGINNRITVLQKAAQSLFNGIAQLYHKVNTIKCKSAIPNNNDIVSKFYALMNHVNILLQSKIDQNTLLKKKEKDNKDTVIEDTEEYKKYVNQFNMIKAKEDLCNKK